MNENIIPHSYYPRPQLVRDSFISLNGDWEFSLQSSLEYRADSENTQTIRVPFPPESALSGIGKHHSKGQILAYRKSFAFNKESNSGRVILHFGAVDTECAIYLNGQPVGKNEGGYIPFSFDITDKLLESNELFVAVKDELDVKYPYGKQTNKRGGMWYTPVSGIWQSVWLECVPEKYITSLVINTDDKTATVRVLGDAVAEKAVFESGEEFTFDNNECVISFQSTMLWSPDEPNIYRFTVYAGEDSVRSYLAFRKIEIAEHGGQSRILLNGKPIIINALLDQGYFDDGLFLPETEDGYLSDIRLAKSLGFNALRKHIKIEPMLFYHLCDTEGILVLQDMVNNGKYSFFRDTALPTVGMQRISDKRLHKSKESRQIFLNTMRATAELLHNSPCVVYYTIFNEGWGQFSSDEAYKILKSIDSSRIIDSTSGWFRQSLSDVDSRHIYFKALGVKHRDERPLAISEFGGYSHRVEGHLFGEKNYGYRSFGSREEFESAFINLYENEVIPLAKDGGCVFVYTQLSDVEDETNGLITYDREVVKVTPEKIKAVMDKLYATISE